MKSKICLTLLFAVNFAAAQKNWTRDAYVPKICVCGTSGKCEIAETGGISDGSGNIAPRIVATGDDENFYTGSAEESCQPVSTGIPIDALSQSDCSRSQDLERCCPPVGYSCGLKYPPVRNAPKATLGSGQAEYGGYPWHAVINGPNNTFIASGVLIDHKHVLTAAHKLFNLNETTVEVRLGVFNRLNNNSDPFPTLIYSATFVIHPSFTMKNLKYNIAVLTLSNVVPLGQYPTIANICLPNTTISNMRCFVSGFGFPDVNTRILQRTIMEIDVGLVDRETCQKQLIATKLLNSNFQLDGKHFICAGGDLKRDACFGDGGSPLSCRVFDRFYLVGLVAWGLGCGNFSIPGVYVNVVSFIPWIQQVIKLEAKSTTTSVKTTTMNTTTTSNPNAAMASTKVVSNEATTARTTVKMGVTTAKTTVKTTVKASAKKSIKEETGKTAVKSTVKPALKAAAKTTKATKKTTKI